MGWASADILGGDAPMDAIGGLEKAIGWDYNKSGFMMDDKNADEVRRRLTTKTGSLKMVRYIRKLAKIEYDMADGSVLGAIYLLLKVGVKLTDEIAQIGRDAVKRDEWGLEGDEERLIALGDFTVRLNANVAGKSAAKRTFRLHMERTIRYEAVFEVEATSELEARSMADEAAKTARTIKEPFTLWATNLRTNIWHENALGSRPRVRSTKEVEGTPAD